MVGKPVGSGSAYGEKAGMMANAPPPETCQLTARYFWRQRNPHQTKLLGDEPATEGGCRARAPAYALPVCLRLRLGADHLGLVLGSNSPRQQ